MINILNVKFRWLILLVFLVPGCTTLPRGTYPEEAASATNDRRLVLWMLSDIQPKTREARSDLSRRYRMVAGPGTGEPG